MTQIQPLRRSTDLTSTTDGAVKLPADMLSHHLTDGLDGDLPETRDYRRLLAQALDLAAEARRDLAQANRRIAVLEHQSRTDPATGILNRRGFEFAVEDALGRALRKGETGLMVMIDLDGFKPVNDTHGHQAGDKVLVHVANMLQRHIRGTDKVARMGGDEFAVLLTDADQDGALKRVSILDRLLNGATVQWMGHQIPIRASFGWSVYQPGDTVDAVLDRADKAMYQKKYARD